ncbi:pilin [Marinomonas ostreistagni]|uniref:pilin n=1 Tax=Marinomonas ostreistagni TaxID=359209 RepID=UPI001950C10A|nr:prepilin-type N-terminal cleavage/methylation domain-containing protein [Marinomonas ostreistagni]MBM6550258.1 pilin [Marinomonas ostreistagni]
MTHVPQPNAGFTLVELMVVVAIISILAAFTAPSFERHIAKANLVDSQLFSNRLSSAIDEFIMIQSHYPNDTEFAELTPSFSHIDEISTVQNNQVDTFQGEFTLTFSDTVGIDQGQYLRYSRQTSGQWLCSTTLDQQIAPQQCQSANLGLQP